MFDAGIQKLGTGVCREESCCEPNKKTELCSFKILGRVKSGSLKMMFLEESLKDMHGLHACKTVCATIQRYQCYYTLRYIVTNVTIYAYYNVTIRYDISLPMLLYMLTITLLYATMQRYILTLVDALPIAVGV